MGKIINVLMPDIGEGVVEGEVIQWLKGVDEAAKQDEPVVILMTDKVTVELPAPHPGKVTKHHYKPGEIAIKGKPLYDLEIEGVEDPQPALKSREETSIQPQIRKTSLPTSSKQQEHQSHETLATPKVRKLAEKAGINLHQIKGSGKEGRIVEADLKQNKREISTSSSIWRLEGDEEQPLVGIQRQMAKKMEISNREIPHFSYFEGVDATRLVQLRANLKEEASHLHLAFTFMPLFIRALSLTIKKFPKINSSIIGNEKLLIHHQHNIGIAMATAQGLIVPVIKRVETMKLEELVRSYELLKGRAEKGVLEPGDTREGSITISNYGSLGNGSWASPVINHPEVAILAISKIQKQPFIKGDDLVVRDRVNLSWSFDHRIIDGAQAAGISSFFTDLLENPLQLL